jgi:hypothetical protein
MSSHWKWLFTAGMLVLGTGTAVAQSGSSTPSTGAGASGDAQVGFQRTANLSSEEMGAQGDSSVTRMDQASAAVGRRQTKAIADRDVVLAECLKDKVTQIDVAARSAREHRSAMRAFPANSAHEYSLIIILKQRVDQLTSEANQCIGKEASALGETNVTSFVDPTLPPDSNQAFFPTIDPPTLTTPPPCASCDR